MVSLVEDRTTHTLLVTKYVGKESINEVSILKTLDHPNIIRLHEYYDESDKLILIQDYYSGGDLSSLYERLKKGNVNYMKGIPSSFLGRVFRDVLEGLKYLHGMGYVHNDVKEDNIMLSVGSLGRGVPLWEHYIDGNITFKAVIIDLGLSYKVRDSDHTPISGTGPYNVLPCTHNPTS